MKVGFMSPLDDSGEFKGASPLNRLGRGEERLTFLCCSVALVVHIQSAEPNLPVVGIHNGILFWFTQATENHIQFRTSPAAEQPIESCPVHK
jgi:hypothetical protein